MASARQLLKINSDIIEAETVMGDSLRELLRITVTFTSPVLNAAVAKVADDWSKVKLASRPAMEVVSETAEEAEDFVEDDDDSIECEDLPELEEDDEEDGDYAEESEELSPPPRKIPTRSKAKSEAPSPVEKDS
jgi:hypothetical protein